MPRFLLTLPLWFGLILIWGCSPGSSQKPPPPPVLLNPNTSVTSKSTDPKPRTEIEEPNPKKEIAAIPPVEDPKDLPPPLLREKDNPPEKDPPIPDGAKPFPKENPVLFLEAKEKGPRKVHLFAEVCLREGPLEALLCKSITKEHESILRIDVDARLIHTALIAAGGKPGSPARFWDPVNDRPDYKPATGTKMKVTITYYKNGKLRTDPAGYWIRDMKAEQDLAINWVFAGSRFVKPPDDPDGKEFYTANNGDLISIANFPDSMLDLPVKSSKEDSERSYEAIKDRIPPLGTKVIITIEPIIES